MKFNLRDLLWLLLVVAVAASWIADRRRQAVEVQQIQETHKQERHEQEARHHSSQATVLEMITRLKDSPKE
jgi:hypothetical protein